MRDPGFSAWRWVVLLLGVSIGLSSLRSFGDEKEKEKKKIVYRSHTQLDFSGDTVQGKVRAPEVFYIFQRKRSEAHHVVQTPASFDYHASAVQDAIGRSLPK